jgi:hypothetical protein
MSNKKKLYNDSKNQSNSELVLYIEGFNKGCLHMSIFIYYSKKSNRIEIFGRRYENKKQKKYYNFVPFYFVSKNIDKICDFIEFHLFKDDKFKLTTYNYNNLYKMEIIDENEIENNKLEETKPVLAVPSKKDEVYCFEQLELNMDENYVLASKEYSKFNRKQLKTCLNLLLYFY